jgi:hypothetical protein
MKLFRKQYDFSRLKRKIRNTIEIIVDGLWVIPAFLALCVVITPFWIVGTMMYDTTFNDREKLLSITGVENIKYNKDGSISFANTFDYKSFDEFIIKIDNQQSGFPHIADYRSFIFTEKYRITTVDKISTLENNGSLKILTDTRNNTRWVCENDNNCYRIVAETKF